jgi:hypothetical protein
MENTQLKKLKNNYTIIDKNLQDFLYTQEPNQQRLQIF